MERYNPYTRGCGSRPADNNMNMNEPMYGMDPMQGMNGMNPIINPIMNPMEGMYNNMPMGGMPCVMCFIPCWPCPMPYGMEGIQDMNDLPHIPNLPNMPQMYGMDFGLPNMPYGD
ncbi:MAG: hypothetical protein WC996_08000, partial [Peptostreptococcales bacterium]